MYENEFKKALNNKQIPRAFLLYGSCRLSIFLALEQLKKTLQHDEKLILRDGEFKFDLAYNYLSENSLFSNSKLLIIELEKAPNIKDIKELLKLNLDDNYFLLAINDGKALKDFEKAFSNNFVRFFEKNTPYEQINLLKDFAKFYDILADENSLALLQKSYEFDIFNAGCELLKYAHKTLDETTLKEHLDENLSLDFDNFFIRLLKNKNPKEFIYKILQNEDEIAILNKLNSTILRLFTISSHLKQHGKIDYKIAFGYTPPMQVCKNLEEQARLFSNIYEEVFKLLLDCEYELKFQNNNSSKEIMYSYLIKFYFLINK